MAESKTKMNKIISRLLIFLWLIQTAIPFYNLPIREESADNTVITQGAGVGLPVLFLTILFSNVFSANKEFVGGTDTTWNTAGNWNPSGVPGTTDSVIIDSNATKNCGLNANGSVNKFTIKSNCVKKFFQTGTATLIIGAGNFSQAGGTFIGNTGAIDINGNFTLSGGSFTSTTGTLSINGVAYTDNTGNFTVTGGTFTHNSGTVKFNHLPSGGATNYATVNVSNSLTLGSLIISNASTNCCSQSKQYYSISYDTLIVTGTFTQIGHIGGGAPNSQYTYLDSGVILAQDSIFAGAYADGGIANIIVNGGNSENQYYKSTGGILPKVFINTSYSLLAASGTTDLYVGEFTLTAGTFSAPTGTLHIEGRPSIDSTGNFTVTGGTFTHNSGTIKLDHYPATYANSHYAMVNVNNSLTVGSLWFNNANTNQNASAHQGYSLSSDTLIVTGTFTQKGYYPGTSNIHYTYLDSGVILAQDSIFAGEYANGGKAIIIVNGGNSENQYYKSTGGLLPSITINNSPYSLIKASGTTDLHVRNFTLTGGTFSAPETLYIDGQPQVDSTGNFTVTGGTFTHNSGILKFDHYPVNYANNYATIAINLPSSNQLTLGSLWFNNGNTNENVSGSQYYTLSSDTLIATGTFTQTGNDRGSTHYTYINSGVILAQGNVSIGVKANGGDASMVFTGSAASQTLTYTGSAMLTGAWKVDKTAGSVVLGSSIVFPGKLRITQGGFSNGASYNLTTGDSLIVGGTYTDTGTGDLILAGPLNNSGTVQINGSGASCGGADSIFIKSSVGGTRRNWGGSGIFQIIDVKLKDMSSTPAITAYSSTDSLNNTTNWTIDANCYVPVITNIRPAAAKRTAIVTMNGDNFLPTQNTGQIVIGTIGLGTAQSWNDSVIVDTIPVTASFGTNNAIITNNAVGKDTAVFRVTNPGITIP